MDELIQEVVAQVDNAGGSLLYPTILENTPFEKRQLLPNALKQARKSGLLTQSVELVDGVIVHQYHKVTV